MIGRRQQGIQDLQSNLDCSPISLIEITKNSCSLGLAEIVNTLWDNDLMVDRVSIIRSVADVFDFPSNQTEGEVGVSGRQSCSCLVNAAFPGCVKVVVTDLPENMLMRAEGLVTYSVWLGER